MPGTYKSKTTVFIICLLVQISEAPVINGQPMQFGAQHGALANASVALPGENGFLNPANAGYLESGIISFNTTQTYGLSELRYGSTHIALPVRAGTVLLTAAGFGFESFQETLFQAGVAYPIRPGSNRRLLIAAVGSIRQTSIDKFGSTRTWGMSFGASVQLTPSVFFGISAIHYLQPIRSISLPKSLLIGLAFLPIDTALVMVSLTHEQFYRPAVGLGLQIQLIPFLAIRSGFSSLPTRYAVGIGIQIGPLSIDLAAERHHALGWTPGISINLAFMRRKDV